MVFCIKKRKIKIFFIKKRKAKADSKASPDSGMTCRFDNPAYVASEFRPEKQDNDYSVVYEPGPYECAKASSDLPGQQKEGVDNINKQSVYEKLGITNPYYM